MEKGFGFLVTLITCASVGLVVVACSDEKDTSEFGGDGVDASTDSPPVFGGSSSGGEGGTSSSGGEGGTPGAKCEPVIPSNYSPSWVAPTEPASPGPCNATTVGSYYDECLATLGNADHQTRCDAWKTANAACGQCIEPTNNGGPIQWHRSRFYYTANIAGCIAIGQDKYSNADCGYAYGAHVNCKRDACAGCWETNSSSFDAQHAGRHALHGLQGRAGDEGLPEGRRGRREDLSHAPDDDVLREAMITSRRSPRPT
jgi:hypothetical protein